MELTISLLFTGLLIIVVTSWRARRIKVYNGLQTKLETEFITDDLDMTGSVEYTNCRSYDWVYENITRSKPSKIGGLIQGYLMDNTLYAGALFALLIGLAGMAIGFFFVFSIITTGTALIVIMMGMAVIIGPGNPKFSEQLLDELLSNEFSDLNREDFVYVSIANKTLKQWLAISFLIGSVLIVLSPWGEMLPGTFAMIVASFAEYVLWNPALFLSELSVPLAILDLFFTPVLVLIIVPGVVYRRLKKRGT